ncbi:hypothetical protein DMJ13_27300 [halophilic archaeon]|nr:hypothetical protein DMJ13_27300 [halophilic archaeon]
MFDYSDGAGREHFSQGVSDAIAFFHYADPTTFETRLDRGLRRSRIRSKTLADVDIDIDIEDTRPLREVERTVDDSGMAYADELQLLEFHDAVPMGVRTPPGTRSDHYGIPEDTADPYEALKLVHLPTIPEGTRDDLDENSPEVQRALRAAYDFLAKLQDDDIDENTYAERLADHVYPMYPLGFDDPADWWTNLVLPVLSRIVKDDDVQGDLTHVPWENQTLTTDEGEDEPND